MPFSVRHLSIFTFALATLFINSVQAKEILISSKAQYEKIAPDLKAGDTVILQNGTWQDFEILLEGEGTEDSPIHLTAQEKGKVILSGESNLRLAGKYLKVSGLVFKNGFTPTSSVIEFRKNKDELAYHSRITEIVIDDYNNPDKQESDYWVAFYGQYNRMDNSYLAAKRNKGVTVAVRLNNEQSQQNYHKIDHNYFGFRPIFGSNGGETLRIGTSHYSLTDSFTLVENNIFERTNGEVEIISVKSGKNKLIGNLFYEARGTLTMRHGNGNLIENNVFLGNGVEHTGGIRVINKDQIIKNNYLYGLTGYRFGSGFTILNGVPNSPINRYHQVDNATITNNSFINLDHIQFAAGSDAERSAVPINSKMENNLIYNESGNHPFTLFDDVSGIKLSNNIANVDVLDELEYGVDKKRITLEKADNGLLYPKGLSVGAPKDLNVITHDEVGPSWYPKAPKTVAFDSGKLHKINASASELLAAINATESGDVIEIAPGNMIVPRLIAINKTLTIRAQQNRRTNISFERTSLFEIQDNGNLKLEGLVISGDESPDAHGNSVIRTKKWGMVNNYRLWVNNSIVTQLDINHSFHFFSTGKGAFADEIILTGNVFSNVTGDILRLDSETEDLGIYNAEYVPLSNNDFTNVQGALAKVYRGGTDESTFGPHFQLTDNTLKQIGNGKRNKTNAGIYLHGIQVTNIDRNTFEMVAPIVIEHTVGEPKTAILNNKFNNTPSPVITEVHVGGEHTATLKNNEFK